MQQTHHLMAVERQYPKTSCFKPISALYSMLHCQLCSICKQPYACSQHFDSLTRQQRQSCPSKTSTLQLPQPNQMCAWVAGSRGMRFRWRSWYGHGTRGIKWLKCPLCLLTVCSVAPSWEPRRLSSSSRGCCGCYSRLDASLACDWCPTNFCRYRAGIAAIDQRACHHQQRQHMHCMSSTETPLRMRHKRSQSEYKAEKTTAFDP